MPGSQPPGWYPAPDSPHALRWWDGLRWTGETRETQRPDEGGSADAPRPQADGGQPPGAGPAVAAWRAPAVEAWEAQGKPEPPRRPRRFGWPRRH